MKRELSGGVEDARESTQSSAHQMPARLGDGEEENGKEVNT